MNDLQVIDKNAKKAITPNPKTMFGLNVELHHQVPVSENLS
jgi:hypothetical protein